MVGEYDRQDETYGIGAVGKLTGLTDHAIRVWERRYGAVIAARAANGRRVYSPADVEKLRLLKSLTDRGVAIGQIAGDDTDALRERLEHMSEMASLSLGDEIRVAVLGDFLPGLLEVGNRTAAPLDVVLSETDRDTFIADLAQHETDVIIVECPVLDSHILDELLEFMELAKADRGMLVYRFGRSRDIRSAAEQDIALLRSPVSADDVRAAVMRSRAPRSKVPGQPARPALMREPADGSPIPRRHFSRQQLTRLARASTAIDCECPKHLVQLATDLTAFEVYSAQCANRNEEDAALHRYLHRTTAEARAMIEAALRRVAEAEAIEY